MPVCVCVCVCVCKALIEGILFVRRRHERWNLELFNSCLKFVKPESPVGIEIKRVKRLHTDKDKSKEKMAGETTHRRRDIQIDMKTGRQADRLTWRQPDRQTDRQTDK